MPDDELAGLACRPPASPQEVARVEQSLRVQFPESYRDFLARADGCEGPLGEGHVALWPVSEIVKLNDAYAVDEFAPGLVLIGSDGGDVAFAIDYRGEDICFASVPFIGMSLKDTQLLAASFGEMLAAIESGAA